MLIILDDSSEFYFQSIQALSAIHAMQRINRTSLQDSNVQKIKSIAHKGRDT